MQARALHYVYKISNRAKTMEFYRNILLMECLRHEEFEEGCEASCNGPYQGKWSKTMIGYGDEDSHFVAELTYNYGVREYTHGNDYNYLKISSKDVFENVKANEYPFELTENGDLLVTDPSGYRFLIANDLDSPKVTGLSLFSSDLVASLAFWHGLLGLTVYSQNEKRLVLGVADDQAKLELVLSDDPVINHATAYGRIAFSCATSELVDLENRIRDNNYTVLTALVSLDTPGKATVHVTILADTDNHEICFVGDEGFRLLSKRDHNAVALLNSVMQNDKSDEWLEKQQQKKQVKQ